MVISNPHVHPFLLAITNGAFRASTMRQEATLEARDSTTYRPVTLHSLIELLEQVEVARHVDGQPRRDDRLAHLLHTWKHMPIYTQQANKTHEHLVCALEDSSRSS